MRVLVYSHRPSTGANTLRAALRSIGVRASRIYGRLQPRDPQIPLINWGCTELKIRTKGRVLNPPDKVRDSVSKLATWRKLDNSDIPCVKITTDRTQAVAWHDRGYKVLVRKDGLSGGKGIRMFAPQIGQPDFDFYSRIFPKTHEFRVHVVGQQVVDLVQKKALNEKDAQINRLIRTHENGWVFAHQGLILSDQADIDKIGNLAKDACNALGLDFGAVDILAMMDEKSPRRLRKAVVCEVNTAPGLENTRTIKAYADGIRRILS